MVEKVPAWSYCKVLEIRREAILERPVSQTGIDNDERAEVGEFAVLLIQQGEDVLGPGGRMVLDVILGLGRVADPCVGSVEGVL